MFEKKNLEKMRPHWRSYPITCSKYIHSWLLGMCRSIGIGHFADTSIGIGHLKSIGIGEKWPILADTFELNVQS